jgi:hypothetical protein
VFLNVILANTANNVIMGAHGLGTKRLFSMYCGINVNLNKLARVISTVLGQFKLTIDPNNSANNTTTFDANYHTY